MGRNRILIYKIDITYNLNITYLNSMQKFTLTKDQEHIFQKVKEFLQDDENPAITIKGSAGTGKTTLTKYIVDYIKDNGNMEIVALAPTHKARRVLSKKLNTNRIIEIPSLTIASILGKMKEHTYIGVHKYTNGNVKKMETYDCFILDEVSMVSDKDLDEIIEYICSNDKKLILIGDDCQISSPSQLVIQSKDSMTCYKSDSTAFDIVNMYELHEIVRQCSNSPIISIATYLRDNLLEDLELNDILHNLGVLNLSKEEVCISFKDLYEEFKKDYQSGLDTRIIAYTNSSVKSHNQYIRKILGYNSNLVLGDILTGYSNVGFPTPVIENGTDYIVKNIYDTQYHNIKKFSNLVGKIVDLVDLDKTHTSKNLFFINIQHSNNKLFMDELVYFAEKVNQRYSKKEDYKKYCFLKNNTIFLENVYKYEGKVMTVKIFYELHPLLFSKVSDVINVERKSIIQSELTKKLSQQYGEIVEARLIDNKPFADTELFADQYMVVEKDIYYGYSITAHKSQGSTYNNVYVDEHDFKKIKNRWNYKLRMIEDRTKEKNQLKYVSYTRASKKLKIII